MKADSGSADNYHSIMAELQSLAEGGDRTAANLVVVSKTFQAADIEPVLQAGCRVFGENRVQEAQGKWPDLKSRYPDTELHLIGPLQSNKAKDAVALFDVIQTIDREKIAKVVAREVKEQSRNLEFFAQVNIGSEPQKAGLEPSVVTEFVNWCRNEQDMEISGLMCIPPNGENPGPYFALMRKLAEESKTGSLSMGMSADYKIGVEFGATHVRVGSAIFGAR